MMPALTLRLLRAGVLAAVLGAPSAHAADFVNGGFETGSFLGWTQSGGFWYGGTNYPADYTFNEGPYQSAIVMPGDVPCLMNSGASVGQVRSGAYAARLNSNDFFTAGYSGYHFSQIQQTVSNWTSPYFSFDWSAVLQDSGHLHSGRPHFRIILENLPQGATIRNAAYYSDDTTPDMVGDTLAVTILASDCSGGGHDGALYVDNIMGRPQTGHDLPVAPCRENAGCAEELYV